MNQISKTKTPWVTRNTLFAVLPIGGTLASLLLLCSLYYWLMPVAAPTRMSADSVRWAFGSSDLAATVGASLSGVWVLLLKLAAVSKDVLASLGFENLGTPTALSAATSVWFMIAALALLWRQTSWWLALLVALNPVMLWTAVVPNGTTLLLFVLALVGWLARPEITWSSKRPLWLLGVFFQGVACSLSPVAFFYVLWVRMRRRYIDFTARSIAMIRSTVFVVGLGAHAFVAGLIGVFTGESVSFSKLPLANFLNDLRNEDSLGAGFFFFGPHADFARGETFIALVATTVFVVALLSAEKLGHEAPSLKLPKQWLSRWVSVRTLVAVVVALVALLPLLAGFSRGWRLAHPGWNTVLEDFGSNLQRGVPAGTVALVATATEEAMVRYAGELTEERRAVPLRFINLREPATRERLKKLVPQYDDQAFFEQIDAGNIRDQVSGFEAFSQNVLAPNLKKGVTFWFMQMPNLAEGAGAFYMGNGLFLRGHQGPTQIDFSREALRTTHIRSRIEIREYVREADAMGAVNVPIEQSVYRRYADYHVMRARLIEREKPRADWRRIMRVEYYAALKKVPWIEEAYNRLCVEAPPEMSPSPVQNERQQPPEELDACIEAAKLFNSTF
ncbi:MAG: hypothetical protein RBT63_04860 [Bdellovibrionales bacterium]|jgi:hypothetical protein|nr:hypothetical protein [Bdellovibrionales bacterium]